MSAARDQSGSQRGLVGKHIGDQHLPRSLRSGSTRSTVVGKVRDLEKQRDSGVAQDAIKVPSFKEWLDHWLDTTAARRVRPRTLEGYRSKVRKHIIPALGHHRLDRLQPEHVKAFYAECEANGMATASVLQCHRILSRALKVVTQRGKVARNVCTLTDAPSLVRSEVEPLSVTEARQLLGTAKNLRNGARWPIALALGLRQGEALGLQWKDIDLDAGTLTVRRALQRQKGQGLVFVEPKSQAGRRTVVLPDALREGLRAHRTKQLEERIAAGRSIHIVTGSLGRGCCLLPRCATPAFTTRGTRRRLCFFSKGFMPAS